MLLLKVHAFMCIHCNNSTLPPQHHPCSHQGGAGMLKDAIYVDILTDMNI